MTSHMSLLHHVMTCTYLVIRENKLETKSKAMQQKLDKAMRDKKEMGKL